MKLIILITIFFEFIFLKSLIADIKLDQPVIFYKIKGDYFRNIGLLSKALNEYDKAITLKVDYPECYYWNAVIYKKKELYTQALYEIKQAIKYKKLFKFKEMHFKLYFLEVDILKLQGESYKKIENTLNEIIKSINYFKVFTPNNDKKYFNNVLKYFLGKAYFYKGKILKKYKLNTRVMWFNLALKSNYKKDHVFYFLYLLYKQKNMFFQAKNSFSQAFRINSNIVVEYYKNSQF